jgi:hypothetical protein
MDALLRAVNGILAGSLDAFRDHASLQNLVEKGLGNGQSTRTAGQLA